jgi:hypothetical protein
VSAAGRRARPCRCACSRQITIAGLGRRVRVRLTLLLVFCRYHQASPAAATDLPPLTAGRTGFVGRPFMGGTFLVSGASALAGNFPLLFWGHRRESSSFFALGYHFNPPFRVAVGLSLAFSSIIKFCATAASVCAGKLLRKRGVFATISKWVRHGLQRFATEGLVSSSV